MSDRDPHAADDAAAEAAMMQLLRLSGARPSMPAFREARVRAAVHSRWQHDARGYLGLFGQVVLAARLQVEAVDAPLPAYAQPIFGGADTLRGIRAGYSVGDNLWSAMIEARAPITSVLRTTRFGVLAFYDTGANWSYGERWRDAGRSR